MGGFAFAAALLVAVTLLLLLRPWRRNTPPDANSAKEINAGVYRDQLQELDRDLAAGTLSEADHAQARTELQRRLLDDVAQGDAAVVTPFGSRRTTWSLALVLPVAAIGLYLWLGSPAALDPAVTRAPTQQDVEKMVADLAARMERDPSDPKGWIVLARSYRVMGRLPEAQAAFERIGAPLEQDATLLAEYGDVLATRAMGNFEGKPSEVVQRALKLDPQNPMAISLAATAAYNRGDFAGAVSLWENLLRIVPAESEDAKWLQQAVTKTREQMAAGGAQGPVAAASGAQPPQAASAGPSITGRVTLSPGLAAQVQPGDTVFIFARSPQGSRMPLAVQRARAADLPLDFKLDDSSAMSPALRLSSAAEVRIEARISRSGSATPATGDLIGAGPVVKPGASRVEVTIDQVRP